MQGPGGTQTYASYFKCPVTQQVRFPHPVKAYRQAMKNSGFDRSGQPEIAALAGFSFTGKNAMIFSNGDDVIGDAGGHR
jgi:hypothetical protein